MFDRLKFPVTLRVARVAPLFEQVPGVTKMLEPVRQECAGCGAHAYAVCGKGRCGNCGGAALGPLS